MLSTAGEEILAERVETEGKRASKKAKRE